MVSIGKDYCEILDFYYLIIIFLSFYIIKYLWKE